MSARRKKPAKRGPGAPPLDPDGAVRLDVKLTQEQAAKLDELAERHGLGDGRGARSQVLRWLIDRA